MIEIGTDDLVWSLLLFVLLALSWFALRQHTNKHQPDTAIVNLMDHESYIMPTMPSITTITKLKIKEGDIVPHLRAKVTEMIKQNPWLAGRLTRTSASLKVDFRYNATCSPDIANEHLSIVKYEEEDDDMTYGQYLKSFHKYSVLRGGQCINNSHGKLFAVTIVYSTNSDDVYLVFSLSHMIADGFTFYQLYNMLDSSTPVRPLEATRSTLYEPELVKLFGKEHASWHHNWFIPVGLLACSFFRPRMQGYIMKVSNEWLEKQKAAFQTRQTNENSTSSGNKPEYISTNDILTAWHNKISGGNVHVMALNLRNRVPIFTNEMAGNYENTMIYNTPCDGHTPEAIRRSLETFQNNSNTMPGALKTLLRNGSLTTNWSSFYKQIKLSTSITTGATKADMVDSTLGCQQIVHLPLMTAEEMSVWREFMCIFQLDAEHKGLLIYTRKLTAQQLEASGVGTVCATL